MSDCPPRVAGGLNYPQQQGTVPHQLDIVPAFVFHPPPGLSQHCVGQIDANDLAPRPYRPLEQRKVKARSTTDLDDHIARFEHQRVDGFAPVCPLWVADQIVEIGRPVIVLGPRAIQVNDLLSELATRHF